MGVPDVRKSGLLFRQNDTRDISYVRVSLGRLPCITSEARRKQGNDILWRRPKVSVYLQYARIPGVRGSSIYHTVQL